MTERLHYNSLYLGKGFPCGSAGKQAACSVGNLGLIPGLGQSPGEGKGYPLQYCGLENSRHGLYSSWGRKESDTTERLSLSLHILGKKKNTNLKRDTYTPMTPNRHDMEET